jgi:hypothetical protein
VNSLLLLRSEVKFCQFLAPEFFFYLGLSVGVIFTARYVLFCSKSPQAIVSSPRFLAQLPRHTLRPILDEKELYWRLNIFFILNSSIFIKEEIVGSDGWAGWTWHEAFFPD